MIIRLTLSETQIKGIICVIVVWCIYFALEALKHKYEALNRWVVVACIGAAISTVGVFVPMILEGILRTDDTEKSEETRKAEETAETAKAHSESVDSEKVVTESDKNVSAENGKSLWTLNADQSMTYNGHKYMLYDRNTYHLKSYAELERFCEEQGGHLAVINSGEENQAIYEYILNLGNTMAFFGYSDEAEEGNWKWITGESNSYTNWDKADGQPNNGAKNSDGQEEDYAHFVRNGGGVWNDAPFGSNTSNFICEWEAISAVGVVSEESAHSGDDSFYLDGTVVLTNGYILPDSDQRYLEEDDIKKLTHKGIRYAINEIYAKNGYKFTKKQELINYFNTQDWYDGGNTTDDSVAKSRMNDYELKNVDLLADLEVTIWGGEYQLH